VSRNSLRCGKEVNEVANWERTKAEKDSPGVVETIIGAMIPIPPYPCRDPDYRVEYTDRDSGRSVEGRGESLQEADRNAQRKI